MEILYCLVQELLYLSSTSKRFSNLWFLCIGLIDFILASKKLTDYTNLFSPHDFNKNDNIILPHFKNE